MPVYERLASCDLPWQEIDVFFSDERCVPPDHPASNYRMADDCLLSKVPARVHRMPGETCAAAGDAALNLEDRWVACVQRSDYCRLTLTLPVLSRRR
jgi:6-phosphogluconolactonase/glucosamine-6-phosphate isomerase/deaminase